MPIVPDTEKHERKSLGFLPVLLLVLLLCGIGGAAFWAHSAGATVTLTSAWGLVWGEEQIRLGDDGGPLPRAAMRIVEHWQVGPVLVERDVPLEWLPTPPVPARAMPR
jgi:hypothetical protein